VQTYSPTNASQSHITYTCGEDSHIRVWQLAEDESMDVDEADLASDKQKSRDKKEKRKEKKEKRKGEEKEKARFKPY
jgi:hypothetical protein